MSSLSVYSVDVGPEAVDNIYQDVIEQELEEEHQRAEEMSLANLDEDNDFNLNIYD